MRHLKINLDESEQRYNRLLRYLTDYIYTVLIEDNKAVSTHHGPGCFTVTGYTSEDYASDPELWYRMVHDEDKEPVLEQANKALFGIEVEALEHRIIHRNGSVRWVRNTIVLSKDEKDRMLSYDGLINDITALKKEKERSETKQRQLIQADKMVSLGTMVTGIAHEINNPTNFVLLNARFLQKVWDDVYPIMKEYANDHEDFIIAGFPLSQSKEKVLQSIEGILNGAMRIQKITKSLTNFARGDAGEMDLPVNINSVISNAILLTNNIVKQSTKNFIAINDKPLPIIKGNPQQLEQVVINLINNACQALTDSKQKILVEAGMIANANWVYIKIEDEGAGIEKENLKHVFDPFFTTKRDSGGTGLGLYVSYNIIRTHGGELIIHSEKGKGTYCEIILPIN
jgi:PAS domain S-box-containing protein